MHNASLGWRPNVNLTFSIVSMTGAHDGSRGLRAAKIWNEPPTMDEELREMIELARVEAEFALLEIQNYGAVHAEQAQRHMEALIVKLDDFLRRTHWSNEASRSQRN